MNDDNNTAAQPVVPQNPSSNQPPISSASLESKATPTSHIIALILTLVALLMALVPILGILATFFTLVFAIVARALAAKNAQNKLTVATAAIVLSIFGLLGGSVSTGVSFLVAKDVKQGLQAQGINLSQLKDLAQSVQEQAKEDRELTQQERREKTANEMGKFAEKYKRLSGKDFGFTDDEIEKSLEKVSDSDLASVRQVLRVLSSGADMMPPEALEEMAVVLRVSLQKGADAEAHPSKASDTIPVRQCKSDDDDDDDHDDDHHDEHDDDVDDDKDDHDDKDDD